MRDNRKFFCTEAWKSQVWAGMWDRDCFQTHPAHVFVSVSVRPLPADTMRRNFKHARHQRFGERKRKFEC
jgi:hypothetical protein